MHVHTDTWQTKLWYNRTMNASKFINVISTMMWVLIGIIACGYLDPSVLRLPLLYVTTATAYDWASKQNLFESFSVHHSQRPPRRVVSRVLALFLIQSVSELIMSSLFSPPLHEDDTHPSMIKLLLSALLLDTYQYWAHRAMHTYPILYRNVHKVHHELRTPVAWGALYNSFSECMFVDVTSFVVAQVCTGLNPLEAFILGSAATIKTISDHSGFVFVKCCTNDASYHSKHHANHNGNFQQPFFTFWDDWMGTRI